MATYPNTSSILDAKDAKHGTTRTGLSTQILVYVGDEPVGAIQSFQETQARQNKKIAEVGTDGWIEIVPQSPASVSLTVQRIVFDGLSLPESFSRGYKNIHSQRIPFDIYVVDKFAGGGDDGSIVTIYHNCWFNNLSKSYTVNDYTITESANIDCEWVTSERKGGPVAETQGVGGGRKIEGIQKDQVEQDADMGFEGRRGALDFAGLIEAQYPDP